ncbi:MAG: hypothetical protein E7328_07110 [Clostridiales bacterium]|nr:hypothetical protein [Clostridiales bacterium]
MPTILQSDRICPITGHPISPEVCYEVVLSLVCGMLSIGSVPEVSITDSDRATAVCVACPYSDID